MLNTFLAADMATARRKIRGPFRAYMESVSNLWFHLSFRDVQDLLAERRVVVSHEANPSVVHQIGATFAARLCRRRVRAGDKWHLGWPRAWFGPVHRGGPGAGSADAGRPK
jgi:hypothetical protein